MKAYSLALVLVLVGCASAATKPLITGSPTDPIDLSEGVRLPLPKIVADELPRSPFFNTQKSVLTTESGFTYNFFYGLGGRYLVQLQAPSSQLVDFKNSEVSLAVDVEGNHPEILALSHDQPNLFVGSGQTRRGLVKYTLTVMIPASRYNGEIRHQLDFELHLQDSDGGNE